jgi:hypothetical protein
MYHICSAWDALGNPPLTCSLQCIALIQSYVPSMCCLVCIGISASAIPCILIALIHSFVPSMCCLVYVRIPTSANSYICIALICSYVPSMLCLGCFGKPNTNMQPSMHSFNKIICTKYALPSMHRDTHHYHLLHIPSSNTCICTK